MVIAQFSDPHVCPPGSTIDRFSHPAEHLERAVAHLNAIRPRPDVVLGTGDLVEHGTIAEYERLRAILEPLAMPVFLIPGNHDDRAALVRVFDRHRYLPRDGGFLHYTVEDGPVRLVALDTLVPGEAGGRLDATRLAWLDARLAEAPDRPTLVLMHHPPFRSGLAAMDAMGLEGHDALAALIRRHPQVERIVCGHLHRPIARRVAGTVAVVCPATAHQVALDLPPATRLAIVMEPPAVMLHVWLGAADGLVTHVSQIERREALVVSDGSRWLAPPVPAAG
jgi:Icc protein